jgi:hypothetical protein
VSLLFGLSEEFWLAIIICDLKLLMPGLSGACALEGIKKINVPSHGASFF